MVNSILMKNIKIKFNYVTLYLLLIVLLCGFIKYALYVLFIVLFHEIGHIFITILLGYNIKSIEIFPFGGMSKIDKPLNTPIIHDLLIAVFGVVFQLMLSLFGIIANIDYTFLKINQSIMLFNLLPIIPLDGSKILFEIYCLFFSFRKSLNLYYLSSLAFLGIFLFFNYKYLLSNYLLIGLFIYKTIEVIKNKRIICHKFILERCLYNNLVFKKVKNNNESVENFQKDVKYYYLIDSKIISDKEYLINYYFDY